MDSMEYSADDHDMSAFAPGMSEPSAADFGGHASAVSMVSAPKASKAPRKKPSKSISAGAGGNPLPIKK